MFRKATYRGVHVFHIEHDGPNKQISSNFVLKEFACRDGSPLVLIHRALPNLLEIIRRDCQKAVGLPVKVVITSGFRSEAHNTRIGGAKKSKHLGGFAADIKVYYKTEDDWAQMPPNVVAHVAEASNPGGVGRYDTFTHVDTWGKNRRWDQRTHV